MADSPSTARSRGTTARPVPASAPFEQIVAREMLVLIDPLDLGSWSYVGTRAQLEAEGVIPPGTKWPEVKGGVSWIAGRFRYWLRRERPENAKGLRFPWGGADWWCLMCHDMQGPAFHERRLWRLQREVAREQYRLTPQGYAEEITIRDRYWQAHRDPAFQAFKSSFIPAPKRPGRTMKLRTAGPGAEA